MTAIELVEPRRFLAVDVSLLADGTLRIVGDHRDNGVGVTVTEQLDAIVLYTEGHPGTLFPVDAVTRVRIDGRGGDDNISYSALVPATLIGGGGNDQLSASNVTEGPSPGNIFMDAGSGDDQLYIAYTVDNVTALGGAGDDRFDYDGLATMIGGAGNDIFDDNTSDSQVPLIVAGAGYDSWFLDEANYVPELTMPDGLEALSIYHGGEIHGNALDNVIEVSVAATIHGGAGNDLIRPSNPGQEDDLVFFGDAGDDTLIGGENDDQLNGGAGRDVVIGADGDDTLAGGAGRDILIGGDGFDTAVMPARDILIGVENIEQLVGPTRGDEQAFLSAQLEI